MLMDQLLPLIFSEGPEEGNISLRSRNGEYLIPLDERFCGLASLTFWTD